MRKLLLPCFILLAVSGIAPGLLAQKSVPVSDTTYIDYDSKLAGEPYSWSRTFYNERCLDTLREVYYPLYPQGNNRQLKSYYPDGKLYRLVQESYDTLSEGYYPVKRTTYTYNPSGQTQMMTDEVPAGSGWGPYATGMFQYDAAGHDTLYLYKTWDVTAQAYVNDWETVNRFDAAGRPNYTEYRDWNADEGIWEPFFGVYQSFNAAGYQTSYRVGVSDYVSDGYDTILHSEYYVNGAGLTDSSYQTDLYPYYTDSLRTYYSYYPSSGLIATSTRYTYADYFNSGLTYRGGNISSVFYDSSGYRKQDSTITKTFSATPDRANPGGNVYLRFRDSAGYVTTDSSCTKSFMDTPGDATIIFSTNLINAFNEYGQRVTFILRQQQYAGSGNISYREDDTRYTLCTDALPVTFLRFAATQKNKDAVLTWQTVNETNAAYYTIERSLDGTHFTGIGKIAAAGGTARKDYAYADANFTLLAATKVWYRLAERDVDGKITYSPTALLTLSGGTLSVTVSPNPVRDAIVVYSPVAMPDAVISVADMNGRVLQSVKRNLSGGSVTILDASGLAKGMYVVMVQSGTGKQVFKIVK